MSSQIAQALMTSLLCSLFPGSAQQMVKSAPATQAQVMESYGKLPLSFEANRGQTDQRVKFLSRGAGYTLFLTGDSAVLSLRGQKANAALRMKLAARMCMLRPQEWTRCPARATISKATIQSSGTRTFPPIGR